MEGEKKWACQWLWISFLFRSHGPDCISCCPSLWPPEGWVQVSSQEQQFDQLPRCAEEQKELGWMLESWSRGGVMEMQTSHTLQPTWAAVWVLIACLCQVPGAPVCASVWLRLRGATVKTVLPFSYSGSYGLGLWVPGGSWWGLCQCVVPILTSPLVKLGIMIVIVLIFN